jgi:hypothetical protein
MRELSNFILFWEIFTLMLLLNSDNWGHKAHTVVQARILAHLPSKRSSTAKQWVPAPSSKASTTFANHPSSATTVKTIYNDAGCTADRIVILMVFLYIESRIGLISRKKDANAWPGILKGCRYKSIYIRSRHSRNIFAITNVFLAIYRRKAGYVLVGYLLHGLCRALPYKISTGYTDFRRENLTIL